MLRELLLLIHLLCAIAWLGGMFFAYFCLRPAAAEVLKPPDRLPLWSATFARFLPYMAFAVTFILASGLAMLVPIGFAAAPTGWLIMLSLGVLMAVVFAYVYLVLFPRLRSHCASSAWPEAGKVLNRIRQLVALNLVLGLL
ncbi:MAG: CopD family protein, partial [Burkholderiales bacterium]